MQVTPSTRDKERGTLGRSAEPDDGPRAVTRRSLVIGAVGALAIGLAGPYAEHGLHGSYMTMYPTWPFAVALTFFLVAGPNLVLLRFRKLLALTTAEIVVIFGMMAVASTIVTTGLTDYLVPWITAPYYYASPENKWAETILPHLPPWLSPRGAAQNAPVITHLYEGLPPGAQVPWVAWLPALGAWLVFLLCLHLAMVCMAVLLRKQWVENEHLVYPLAYLPLALGGAESGGRPVILSRGLFWVGFGISLLVTSSKGLVYYFPSFPGIRATGIMLDAPLLPQAVFAFWISLPILGFLYLVSLDVNFSLWFFNLLQQLVSAILNVLGIASTENLGEQGARTPIFRYLGAGAFLALVGSGLWVARRHFKDIWAEARGQGDPGGDSGEMLSYRVAFWLLIGCVIVMAWWLVMSGLSVIGVVFLLVIGFVAIVGLTRIIAESGLPEIWAPYGSATVVAGWLGWGPLGNRGIVALLMAHVWASDSRQYVMTPVAHTLKMAQVITDKQPRLLWAFGIAFLVALFSSMWITTRTGYHQGAVSMMGGASSWAFVRGPQRHLAWAADWVARRPGPSLTGHLLTGLGAAIYVSLVAMRFRFLWWPFHPIGFALGGIGGMDWLWFTCFVAWLVKGLALRYGGMKCYQRLRPVFLGLICGYYVSTTLWLVIDQLTGHTGNMIDIGI